MTKKLLYLCAFALIMPFGALSQNSSSFGAYKFVRFIQYLSGDYVDTINVNKLVDNAIVEILSQLDPHSIYISKEDVQAMNEPLEGNFEGIGVEFNILNDTLMVVNPISGGPSERVGILAGDRIIAIDGKSITNINLKITDVHKLLRGPKGTKVTVLIHRKSLSTPVEFTITRDRIPIYSIDASYMAEQGIGYIKINRFAATTEQEFVEAMNKLNQQKMNDLIIDLRNNGGGLLNSAYDLANYFFDPGKLIVYTEGRNSPRTNYFSTSKNKVFRGRVVVLIDEGSASASEILAGAFQDWDRGIIVGRRSFGKGLVQNQLPLPDGSMIRLTVARYFTPTGRAIQRQYKFGDLKDYYSDMTQRYDRGELFNKDSIHFADSLTYKTLIRHKTVYGGGGIMPDVFIPLDTNYYSDYYGKLVRSGVINQFSLTWVDTHRNELLKEYPKFDKFKKNFQVTEKMISELVALAESSGIPSDEKGLAQSANELKIQLKGLVAQSIFSTSHYFEVTNETNETYQKALEIFHSWNDYKHLVQE
ncbi:MAG TPA: S41 family peptidase [Tenuifilaceae bacterium]|jgi:carboxyl-terminal processing protease|nr:S41 family peptidase [Bacteroidales bacterium]HOG72963.1 S41 family peptidase [Tenuifilaceae bacterium]NLI87430.1 S41 family peptidase [Bacteroidales bacterium]HOW21607.1 S41 family peptidase [Tenuifilaceae bacterium]HOY72407.1 S41 family peptidase [Tenuifilaceae bacterium]